MLCFVPHCCHYTENSTCKFYRFPKDEKERKKWIKLIRRQDKEPKDTSRVCSCHFENGEKANGPTIFKWNTKSTFKFQSPEKKQRKKRNSTSGTLPKNAYTDHSYSSTDTIDNIILSNSDAEIVNVDVTDTAINYKSTQTSSSITVEAENILLRSELEKSQFEVERLKKQPFSYQCIEDDDRVLKYYSGLSKEAFDIVLQMCSTVQFNYSYDWKVRNFNLRDQLLITLMKLKLNLDYTDLSIRFNTSVHTIGNIVLTFIHLLHELLFVRLMKEVPSQEKNALCLPNCFVSFRNCRMIIDCTEFTCAIPKRLDEQKETYSNYKDRNTLKGLVGVAPNGVITYCSRLYPGSTSDKQIVRHSEIVKIFEPGDLILAEKGFLFDDVVPDNVSVNLPSFSYNSQFTPAEDEKTKSMVRARIHIERAVRRLKYFRILTFIPKSLYKYSSLVFQLCGALTNFQNPLIKEVEEEELYNSDFEDTLSANESDDEIIIDLDE